METKIEEFNPTKAEITTIVDKYSTLTIKDINDVEGYAKVDEGRKELKKMRVAIKKYGKGQREQFIQAQKEVLRQEKELVDMVEPTEKRLIEEQTRIKEEKEKQSRLKFLPDRRQHFREIEYDITDEEILELSDEDYQILYLELRHKFMEKKEEEAEEKRLAEERKIQAEKDKIAEEKREIEAEKERIKAAEEAKVKAEKQAKLDAEVEKENVKKQVAEAARIAEENKVNAVKEAEEKAEREKQELIDEQNRKEKERLEEIERDKQIRAEAEAKLKIEKEKLERAENYKKFLADNGYTNETKEQFHLEKTDTHMILYKYVNKFNFKD